MKNLATDPFCDKCNYSKPNCACPPKKHVRRNFDPDKLIQSGTGVKHDDNKPPLSLIPQRGLIEVAKVLSFGAEKYAAHNWRGGMQWSRLISSAMRHLIAFNEGEDNDPESGRSHLAHAGCCIMFLLEYEKSHRDKDDRYKE